MPHDATDERPREPDLKTDSRRTFAIVGVLSLLAFALVAAAWQIATAGIPTLRPGSASAAAKVDPTVDATHSARPSETFVVPAPSYATPSLDAPLGPPVPMVEQAPPAAPAAAAAAPSAPAAPAPKATAAPAPPAPAAIKVSNVALTCKGSRGRITASLSFASSAPVPVMLTAGDRTEGTTAGGDVSLSIDSRRAQSGACSAVVNGVGVGPVPAS